jgi:hypothetical protein
MPEPTTTAAIITVAGNLLGGLLSSGGSGKPGLKKAQADVARAEAENFQLRNEQFKKLLGIIDKIEAGGRPPTFQFNRAAGGPANDREFLEGIGHMLPIRLRSGLLGQGLGTSNLNAFNQQRAFEDAQRDQLIADSASSIATIVANLLAD